MPPPSLAVGTALGPCSNEDPVCLRRPRDSAARFGDVTLDSKTIEPLVRRRTHAGDR